MTICPLEICSLALWTLIHGPLVCGSATEDSPHESGRKKGHHRRMLSQRTLKIYINVFNGSFVVAFIFTQIECTVIQESISFFATNVLASI